MRAKLDLVPDCDVHGEPMYLDECSPSALGLEGVRDVIVWRCAHDGCGRYFLGTVGYRDCPGFVGKGVPTPRCRRESAFLVAQRALSLYVCPVGGCKTVQGWEASKQPLIGTSIASQGGELAGHLING